ncbi:hypothetical protein PCAR4_40038 [Paraburkholderia caribensis]|nr:hypothetical protein PCAR4_40038 [Paraburkholderia caribensis]
MWARKHPLKIKCNVELPNPAALCAPANVHGRLRAPDGVDTHARSRPEMSPFAHAAE